MELLRDESFTLKDGEFDYRLVLHTIDNEYCKTRDYVGYRLLYGSVELFAGSAKIRPGNGLDCDGTVLWVLGMLCAQKGEVLADFFDRYTPSQIQFRDLYAEDLMLAAAHRFPSTARDLGYDFDDEESPEPAAA